jgi:hypothetical protein
MNVITDRADLWEIGERIKLALYLIDFRFSDLIPGVLANQGRNINKIAFDEGGA